MGRHALAPRGRAPLPLRRLSVTLVWLTGIAAGLFTLLAGASRFATCTSAATGLACHSGGTVLSVVLLVTIVAAVTAATVLTAACRPPHLAVLTVVAIAVLTGLLVGARSLLRTA